MNTKPKSLKHYKQKTNEIYCEQLNAIKNTWDILGVSKDYKKKFIMQARELNSESIKEYYNYEQEVLSKYRDILSVIINYYPYIIFKKLRNFTKK